MDEEIKLDIFYPERTTICPICGGKMIYKEQGIFKWLNYCGDHKCVYINGGLENYYVVIFGYKWSINYDSEYITSKEINFRCKHIEEVIAYFKWNDRYLMEILSME